MKKVRSISIEQDIDTRAHQYATDNKRSFSCLVELALDNYISARIKQPIEWVKPLNNRRGS